MLIVYQKGADGRTARAADPAAALDQDGLVWIDLLSPTPEEEAAVERRLTVDAPTSSERAALEESSRFYEADGALYLTATLLARKTPESFLTDSVSFILAKNVLLTVREITPRAFETDAGRASVQISAATDGPQALMALLSAVTERLADLLQFSGKEANGLSNSIFVTGPRGPNMRRVLGVLGRLGAQINQAHASLASLQRLTAFTTHVCTRHGLDQGPLVSLTRDVEQLERTAEAEQNMLTFLLDAALGIVGVTQNNQLGVLTVGTLVFLPATLIASIFGMNFKYLAWLDAPWGPWLAMALMIGSAALIYAAISSRKWF
jgi:magnesium transporter